MKLNYTIDHRFIDGAKAKKILNAMEDVFENPEKYSE
jgi:pyruvate/2-oxoglutarate dehydrogenase complex dihydrolipoamide acyltransferase (E2) component